MPVAELVVEKDIAALERAAAAAATRGDLDGAAEFFQLAIEADAERPAPRLGLARIELAAGRPHAALPQLDAAAASLQTLPESERPADLRWLHGTARLSSVDPEIEDRGIADLRAEIADGPYAVEAALELADHLARRERYGDALGVVDSVLERRPGHPGLSLARGRCLADIASWDLAADQLRVVVVAHPAAIDARFELALVEAARGRLDAARREIERVFEDAPDRWLHRHGIELESLSSSVDGLVESGAKGADARVLSLRQLLAVIRSNRMTVVDRVAALNTLLTFDDLAVRRRAARVAALQHEVLVRATAVRRWPETDPDAAQALELALVHDDAPRVRAVAARRLAELPGEDRARRAKLLLESLSTEDDPEAFRSEHDALAVLTDGRAPYLPVGAESVPERRASVAREWKRFWQSW